MRAMSEKQIKKILKKERARKTARGIGAFFGTLTSLAVLRIMFPSAFKIIDGKGSDDEK